MVDERSLSCYNLPYMKLIIFLFALLASIAACFMFGIIQVAAFLVIAYFLIELAAVLGQERS